MGTNYCSNCGSRNVSQPGITQKYCGSCGQSFITAHVAPPISVSPTPKTQSFKPKNRHQEEEDDLEFPEGLPELRASDIVIEGGRHKFTKIGDLGPHAEIDGPRVRNPQEISAEVFKAQWKVDAGSRGRGISTEIGE